jgi:hypothetical protein
VAAQNQVIVNLTANAKGFVAGTSQAQKALQNFNQGIIASTQGVTKFRGANGQFISTVGAAKQVVAQLKAEKEAMARIDALLTNNLSKQDVALLRNAGLMRGTKDAAGSASFAILSLGQGIGDAAQFSQGLSQGIRAVNNNIQQFATAAVFAAQAAGGAGKAFRQMWASLAGPAGLILAVSGITAAIEVFSTVLERSEKKAKDAGDAYASLASEIVNVNASLSDATTGFTIDQAREGVAILEEQLGVLRHYNSEQLAALMAPQNILAQGIDAVTEAGKRGVAAITGFGAVAESQFAAQEAAQEKINELVARGGEDALRADIALLVQLKEQIAAYERRLVLLDRAKAAGGEIIVDEDKKKDKIKEGNLYLTESERLLMDIADLNEIIGSDEEKRVGQLESQIDLLNQINDLNQEKAALETISAQLAAVQAGADQTLIASQIQRIVNTREETEALREKIREQLLDLGMTNEQIDQLKMFGKTAEEEMTRSEKAVARLNEAFAKAAGQGLAQMATGLIDMAVSGTSFKQAILSPLADMAIQLGKTAIAIGITMLELRSVFANPAAAIAAGVALLALGKIIKSSIGKSAPGSGAASSTGYARPNFTMPNPMTSPASFNSQGMFPATSNAPSFSGRFVASGRDLVAVVNAETETRQEFGFTRNLVIGG